MACSTNGRNGGVAGESEPEEDGRRLWGQIVLGHAGHREQFGFYSKCSEKVLEGFKQENSISRLTLQKANSRHTGESKKRSREYPEASAAVYVEMLSHHYGWKTVESTHTTLSSVCTENPESGEG